jgi:predicted MPP superfamily phosphohydrolase
MHFGHATAKDWHRLNVAPASTRIHGCLRVVSYPWEPLRGTDQRLVFFSDLHFWRKRPERLPLVVEAINAEEPDWILFGGDLCRHLSDLAPALAALAPLRAKSGKIAVPGNRETAHTWLPQEFWPQTFDKVGFRYLVNEAIEAGPMLVAGLDDPRHGDPRPRILDTCRDDGRPVLTLCHSPDGTVGDEGQDIGDLVLSGHTHGGQFRIPWFGAIYTSSAYGRQFDCGWFERSDGTRLHVCRGCGETGTPLLRRRIFCPPEILVLQAPSA